MMYLSEKVVDCHRENGTSSHHTLKWNTNLQMQSLETNCAFSFMHLQFTQVERERNLMGRTGNNWIFYNMNQKCYRSISNKIHFKKANNR